MQVLQVNHNHFQKSIVNNICKATGSRNRGVSIVDNMTGLNWSKVPVTIVEMGFYQIQEKIDCFQVRIIKIKLFKEL